MEWMTEAVSVLSRAVSKFCEINEIPQYDIWPFLIRHTVNHAVKKRTPHICSTMMKPTTVDGIITRS